MRLVGTLGIPFKDEDYVRRLWCDGDHVALREYIDNNGDLDLEVEE